MAAGEENGELSPVSSAEGCYSQQGEEEPASGMRQKVAAPNPASLNPLFFLNQSSDQEAPPQQQELQQQQGDVGAGPNGAVPIRRRRTGHDKQERAQAAAAAADHPRVAGGKRKASVEAPLESEPPAVKRQASRKSLAIPAAGAENAAGAAAPTAGTTAGPAPVLCTTNGTSAARGKGVPASKAGTSAARGSKAAKLPASVAERARKAEEAHAARRAAAVAKAQSRG